MKSKLKILFFFILSGCALSLYAGNPIAYLNFATFTTPSGQSYFETYLSVDGSSLKFVKNKNNRYSAKIHVILSFKSGDSIVKSANFNVVSPEVDDTLTKPDFKDVHRFWIPKGEYTLMFTLDDPNDASQKVVAGKQPIHTGYATDTVTISDAEFLSSFTPSNALGAYNKCGYFMVPYVFSDYPKEVKKLSFYCEIYNTIKYVPREKVTVKYAVEDDGSSMINLSSNNFVSATQIDADTVIPFLAQVPIDNLATGNYYLVVSVIDINNHTLAKHKYSFTKQNSGVKSARISGGWAPYMSSRDTLEECIHC